MQASFLKKKIKAESTDQGRELVWHPRHMDDSTLWKAFRSGDEKALITIFDRFTKTLYNYGYRIIGDRAMAKDAVQELFIELWQNRARLGDTDSIKFYLLKSLRRKLVRQKSTTGIRLFGSLSLDYHRDVTPSQEFVLISEQVSIERREQVMSMLSKLTRRQQEALFLRYFEELNGDQIASVMSLSRQAVYNLIHHALDQLKKMIHP